MADKDEAVCLVSIDGEVQSDVVEKIRAIDQVKIVDALSL